MLVRAMPSHRTAGPLQAPPGCCAGGLYTQRREQALQQPVGVPQSMPIASLMRAPCRLPSCDSLPHVLGDVGLMRLGGGGKDLKARTARGALHCSQQPAAQNGVQRRGLGTHGLRAGRCRRSAMPLSALSGLSRLSGLSGACSLQAPGKAKKGNQSPWGEPGWGMAMGTRGLRSQQL